MAAEERPHFMDVARLGDLAPLLAKQQAMVTVSSAASVTEALGLLRAKNILSLPVVDADGTIVGLVNLSDLVSAIVFQPVFSTYNTDMAIAELDIETLNAAQDLTVFDSPVSNFVGVTRESERVWQFRAEDPLRKAVEAMVAGVHRAVLSLPEGNRILSQTDVVRFLAGMKEKPAAFSETVAAAGLARGHVLTISTAHTALTAFRKLLSTQETPMSAMAIVDDEGRLAGTLSLSDLRGFRKDFFNLVLLSVPDFLEFVHEHAPVPVSCTAGDTIGDVVERILRARVHRAWVVDADRRPVGVVALGDILLRACYPH